MLRGNEEPVRFEQGSRPTPASPQPSNSVYKYYADGTVVIHTGGPTPAILAEYEQAINDAPEDAGLRFYYSSALRKSGRSDKALFQMREAVRIAPDWHMAHSGLAALLLSSGDSSEAIEECGEAIRLVQSLDEPGFKGGQNMVLARWSLASALHQAGNIKEARKELVQAIGLQRDLISKYNVGERLLDQLESALVEWK